MLLFMIFDEKKKKKNRIGVWFSCNFSSFLAIGTYIVTYGAGEKSCCQWCRFSYLWCYCLWCNLVTKGKSSCQWCTLAFGAVTNRSSAIVRCGGRGCVWTKVRWTLALPVWHCRRTLKGTLEQNYLFVWDSCLRWFMGVINKNVVHSKSRLP